jgi:putrescine importer
MDVSRDVGGPLLYQGLAVILIIANVGSGMTAQAGIARLLFGMGRDRVLPGRWLRQLSPETGMPSFNILLVGVGALGGALILNYEKAAELINFGAFLAFIGVNAAALRHTLRNQRPLGISGFLYKLLPPIGGLLFCLAIWVSLPRPAFITGSIWLAFGIIYQAISPRLPICHASHRLAAGKNSLAAINNI